MRPGAAAAAAREPDLGSGRHGLPHAHGDAVALEVPVPRVLAVPVGEDHVVGRLAERLGVHVGLPVMGGHDHTVERGEDRHADLLLPKADDVGVMAAVSGVRAIRAIEIEQHTAAPEINMVVDDEVLPDCPTLREERVRLGRTHRSLWKEWLRLADRSGTVVKILDASAASENTPGGRGRRLLIEGRPAGVGLILLRAAGGGRNQHGTHDDCEGAASRANGTPSQPPRAGATAASA